MTIRARLLASFATGAAVTLVLGATAYYVAAVGERAVTEIGSVRMPSVQALLVMNEAMSAVDAAENALLARGATTAQRDAEFRKFAAARKRIDDARAIYEPLPQTAEEAVLWKAFVPAWDAWWRQHEAYVALARAFEADPSDANYQAQVTFALDTTAASFNEVEALLDRLEALNEAVGESAAAEAMRHSALLKSVVLAGAAAAVALAVGLGLFASRKLNTVLATSTRDLREGALQVVAASSQVALSAQELAQGATAQAASIEETAASVEVMAAMTRDNAGHARRGAALVEQSAQEFARCGAALADMVRSTEAILASSREVGRILKTIDEIAFQTRILALNAAVEAARAGEAGLSFAVVADEVRNLARRAADSARDTAALIEQATANAADGTERVKVLGASFGHLGRHSAELKQIVLEVSTGNTRQAEGIDHVRRAIAKIEQVTQSTAATAEASAAASQLLNAQAEASRGVVVQLERLVGHASTDGVGAHPALPGGGADAPSRRAA